MRHLCAGDNPQPIAEQKNCKDQRECIGIRMQQRAKYAKPNDFK
jgi:hypothetical protein